MTCGQDDELTGAVCTEPRLGHHEHQHRDCSDPAVEIAWLIQARPSRWRWSGPFGLLKDAA